VVVALVLSAARRAPAPDPVLGWRMHILWTLLIGFFVGLLARALKPGDDKMGFFATAFLGIAGSFVATYGGQALGLYRPGHSAGFIGATVGAIALLIVGSIVRRLFR